jgi:phosphatidylglycerophosphatase C
MTEVTRPPVVAFDFDGTLTRRDTLLPFLHRLLGLPALLWVLLICSPWLIGYVLRLVSNHRAKAVLLQASLAGRNIERVERCAQAFVREDMPLQWRPWAMKRLLQHQRAGHRCVLVSASTSPYMHLVGANLGVDAVLCTEMEVRDGRYTGKMATANCHGEEKVRRLLVWLAEQDDASAPAPPPALHAYGDTKGDLPLLRLASTAWYRERRWHAD